MKQTERPLVSVVLPTLNAEGIIRNCLESIAKQTYTNIEIIGVDACSTDNTARILEEYGGKVFSFKLSPSMVWGTPYQRNFGGSKAKGKYLYLVDSDMVLPPDAIEAYVQQMEEESADSMIIPEISYGEGFWAKCKILERSCYLLGDSFIEASRFYRKSVWDQLGGWDGRMGAHDDWDFNIRLKEGGYKVTRSNKAIYHNEGKLTLSKCIKKKFTYGKSARAYLKKHGRNKQIYVRQFNVLRPIYFKNWWQLIKDPIHLAGFAFMKTLEAAAFFIGLLRSAISKTEAVPK